MAVIQDIRLTQKAVDWLENVRRDERGNAQAYKDAMTAGKDVPTIAFIALGDANSYLSILNRINACYQANTASFQSGFTALGLLTSELVSDFQELKNAAQAQKTAAQTAATAADINAMADAVLNSVTAHADLH